MYGGTSLILTPFGQKKVSVLVRRPDDFSGCTVHKQGVWDSQMCPVYQGALISGGVLNGAFHCIHCTVSTISAVQRFTQHCILAITPTQHCL